MINEASVRALIKPEQILLNFIKIDDSLSYVLVSKGNANNNMLCNAIRKS